MKLQLVVRRAPMNAALEWLRQGWQLMRSQMQLIALFWLMLLISLLGLLHPLLAIATALLNPFLSAGFYQAIVSVQQQQPISLATLWQPLQQAGSHRLTFIRLAGLNILLTIPNQLLLATEYPLWQQGEVALLPLFCIVALAFINAMLFAYAVPIVYFLREQRLWPVLQASFVACWRNVPALTLYGIIAIALGLTGPLTMLLSWVLILPWLAISFFLSFREFFVLTPARQQEGSTFEV